MPRGKPCGASFIAAWKSCKEGANSHPDFVSKNKGRADELKIKILGNLQQYSPEQQEAWDSYITESFKRHGESRRLSQEEVYVRKLEGWERLTREGPPKELFDQNGESVGSSKALVPTVTGSTGAPAWRAVERGGIVYKYQNGTKKQPGQWRQSTVSMYNDIASGRTQKAIELYEKAKAEAKATGKPIDYPKTNFGRAVDPKEVDKVMDQLRKDGTLRSVAGNGTNRNHSVKLEDKPVGRELLSAVQNTHLRHDPEFREARAREIVTAWLRQDKKSAFTGEPVSIPSLREKDGYPSVVDHDTPISTAWGKNKKSFNTEEQALDALKRFDRAENFSITERGLNTAKSNKTDWDEITTEWKSRIKDQERFEKEAEKVVDLTVRAGARSTPNSPPSPPPAPLRVEKTPAPRKERVAAPKKEKGAPPAPRTPNKEKQLAGVRALASGYVAKGYSPNRIKEELRKLGIPAQLIQEVV